jgi:DNA-binding protein WhiA
MKTLLYGGSFDPPHNGHLNNLRAAAACVRPDRVVVMPAGLSPFKQHTAAPAALRLEYPEAPLKELGTYLDPPVGKSGVNHRLRKISEIADGLRE